MRLPQLLLLGNGLNRSFQGDKASWKELLRENSFNQAVPEDITVPLSLEVVLRTENRAKEMMKKQSESLYGIVSSEEYKATLQKVLAVGFDSILTTNYGYELESAGLDTPKVTKSALAKMSRSTTGRIDSEFLLHTYNELTYANHLNHIWHIHGEAKKPSTMVIDHYHYGSLLNRFINFYRWRGDDAYKSLRRFAELPKESWLDVFMMSDVYILGQGLDFAEMDLWWLINRKCHEAAHGRAKGSIYFYEPKSDRTYDGKIELLKIYGVEPISLNYKLPAKPGRHAPKGERDAYRKKKQKLFRNFYDDAIRDIERRVHKVKGRK